MAMEKSRILDLYKKKIITLEEAIELLEAMGMEMPEDEIRQEDKDRQNASSKAKQFAESVKEEAESFFNSTKEFFTSEKFKNATEKTANTVKDMCTSLFNSAKKTLDFLDMDIVASDDGAIHVDVYSGDRDNLQLIKQDTLELAGNKVKICDRTVESSTRVIFADDSTKLVVKVPDSVVLDLQRSRGGKTVLGITPVSSNISLSGANSLVGQVLLKDTSIEESGASKVEVKGLAGKVSVNMSGACSLEAQEASCSELRVVLSGACSCVVQSGQIESVDVKASGASSATISCIVEQCRADASGATSIHLSKVNGDFDQRTSGVSSISTAGD